MLFPGLAHMYQWTGERRYFEIGMKAVYIAIVSREHSDPLYALASSVLEQARRENLTADDERMCPACRSNGVRVLLDGKR